MTEQPIKQEFRLKKLKWINNYSIKEIEQNQILSNKNKKLFITLNYTEHFLSLVFAVTVCISISDFAFLNDISKEIMSSVIGVNICAIIARIKIYKLIIKKKKKKQDEIAKTDRSHIRFSV